MSVGACLRAGRVRFREKLPTPSRAGVRCAPRPCPLREWEAPSNHRVRTSQIGARESTLPYLDPELNGERLLVGANFASAGIGILNDTGIQFVSHITCYSVLKIHPVSRSLLHSSIVYQYVCMWFLSFLGCCWVVLKLTSEISEIFQ